MNKLDIINLPSSMSLLYSTNQVTIFAFIIYFAFSIIKKFFGQFKFLPLVALPKGNGIHEGPIY